MIFVKFTECCEVHAEPTCGNKTPILKTPKVRDFLVTTAQSGADASGRSKGKSKYWKLVS